MSPSALGPAATTVSHADADAAVADVLEALVGPGATAKPDQLEAVRAVVSDRRRALVVQATGWGKSLVYQAAALASRRAGGGPALVVSPLLALMRDQVDAATRAGLTAATLNSANIDEWQEIEARLLADEVDLLLVSPERLANPRFETSMLQVLLPRLGLLVIDEAHCISDWGFDFRPDYQRLTRVMTARPDLPVLATTATANARVTDDVAAQLGDDTVVLRGPLARASLTLAVVPGLGPLQRYAWVAQALPRLPGSGIVYTLTVAEAERLAAFLASIGLPVEPYTGRMETGRPRAGREPLAAQRDQGRRGDLGAGDGLRQARPRVRHPRRLPGVARGLLPAGRPGRACPRPRRGGAPSRPSPTRPCGSTSPRPTPHRGHRRTPCSTRWRGHDEPVSVPALEQATGLRRARLEGLLKVLAVDGATARVGAGWVSTGQAWAFDARKYDRLVAARRAEADLMRSYAHGAGCLMGFLRTALDDVTVDGEANGCGRCSVCTGTLPAGLAGPVAGRGRRVRPGLLPRAGRRHGPASDVAGRALRPTGSDRARTRSRRRVGRWPSPTTRAGPTSWPRWSGTPPATARSTDEVLAGVVAMLGPLGEGLGTTTGGRGARPVPDPADAGARPRRPDRRGRAPPGRRRAARRRAVPRSRACLEGSRRGRHGRALPRARDVALPDGPVLLVDDYAVVGLDAHGRGRPAAGGRCRDGAPPGPAPDGRAESALHVVVLRCRPGS